MYGHEGGAGGGGVLLIFEPLIMSSLVLFAFLVCYEGIISTILAHY